MGEDNFLYKGETYQILGACFEVYKEKCCGFLEAVDEECLALTEWFALARDQRKALLG